MVCHIGTVNNESKMSRQMFICVSMEVNALMTGWINECMNGKSVIYINKRGIYIDVSTV